jgi:hypothetical protein
MYAMRAWMSSSLSVPALVYDMTISQRPSASTLLRIARKTSPSDQRPSRPAGSVAVRCPRVRDRVGEGSERDQRLPEVAGRRASKC